MRRLAPILCLAVALALPGCAPKLQTAEVFDWAGRPVQFAPPPTDWYRTGYNEGGWLGAYFVHQRSVGERITVAEQQIIAHRDGRPTIAKLLAQCESLDEGQLREALQLARYRTDSPLSAQEGEVAGRVNDALDRAVSASYQRDENGLKQTLSEALDDAKQLQLTLADCLPRVQLRAQMAQDPERWTEVGRRDGTVAGEPALVIDYTYKGEDRTYMCRDIYFTHDNRLFTAGYFGLAGNLPMFEAVVASIQLPAWDPAQ